MASTVTYDGVEGAEGGTIFKDVKFWVAQRVPQRPRWVQLIKQNGGSVVPLEKHADMLIADHARKKDAPRGAYSWKFIQDSVANGYIQLKDKYLIGSHPDSPRPVGSNHPTKSTRTPFTKEDDARLVRWALDHPTERSGNRIWQEYERINGRHTAQSWRDRYVKKLQHLDMASLERMAASAPAETIPGNHSTVKIEQTSNLIGGGSQQAAAQQLPTRKQRADNPPESRPSESVPQHLQETSSLPTTEMAENQVQPTPADDGQDDNARDSFYKDLDEWIALTEEDVKRKLTIQGKSIELFDLTMALQDAPTLDDTQTVDWTKVAEILGFASPSSHLVSELHLCYDENLKGFLDSMQKFDDSEEGDLVLDSEEVVPVADLSQENNWGDGQNRGSPHGYERSSPPVAASGLKRSAGQRLPSSSGYRNKRRRFHPDMEIPSTPEAALATEMLPTRGPSPSALVSSQWRDYVGESEASQHLPPLPPQQDESQDLGMIEVPRQEPRHQSVDIGPLPDNDVLDSTPIPFHLNKISKGTSSASKRRESQTESSRKHRDNSLTHETVLRRAVSSAKPDPKSATRPAVRRSLPASFNPSRNPPPRDTQTRSSDKSNSREIQKRISHYESLGYPRHIVVEALKRTTLTPGKLALLVMQHLSEGRDVPSRHEGIWTDRDDADLESSLSVDFSRSPANDREEREQELAQKAHNRLIKKHGKQRFELRKAFLEAQTTEEGQNPDF